MSGTAIPRTHIDQIPCILVTAGPFLQSSLVQTTGSQIKTSFIPTFYLCYFVLSGGGGVGMEAIQKLHLLSIKKPSYIKCSAGVFSKKKKTYSSKYQKWPKSWFTRCQDILLSVKNNVWHPLLLFF